MLRRKFRRGEENEDVGERKDDYYIFRTVGRDGMENIVGGWDGFRWEIFLYLVLFVCECRGIWGFGDGKLYNG